MPTIEHEISINAPIQICFDIARTVEVHEGKTMLTKQIAIGGVTAGLMEYGDSVTWQSTHLGIKQTLTSRIIEMVRPYHFTDAMVQGAFQSFTHKHEFFQSDTGTIMKDTFSYQSPFGIVGKAADRLFLEKYMIRFIASHAEKVKRAAEAEIAAHQNRLS
ncbi:SRPBCC family protein [Sporosarcina sp. Marseille-Q4943]|uniref:SRPBCC family protein n=1 Tax=Sporosarcina sp. Marseille-Q4943 TaxID=2942204 RepID=UPI00208DD385|nr:SRPBCC family protein [Sporosarcina sp. Marseille-Q4943]